MLGKCFDLSEFLLVDEDNPLRYQDAATSEHVLAWLKYKSNNSTDPDRSELVRGFLEYVQGVTMRPEPRKSSGDLKRPRFCSASYVGASCLAWV